LVVSGHYEGSFLKFLRIVWTGARTNTGSTERSSTPFVQRLSLSWAGSTSKNSLSSSW
jgi:hypothetical protein